MRRTAFWLAVMALVVHTCGLLVRMYIQDRPFVFVTNLYSSAVFIGWGGVILGLILELIFRLGIGNVGRRRSSASLRRSSPTTWPAGGDTLEMMQAVLDTNFWLATHVTCVTLGYAATFVAGFLAWSHVIGLGVVTQAAIGRRSAKAGADDLRRRLLRDAAQLRRHRAGRHLGRSIVGPFLGLGPEGERRL